LTDTKGTYFELELAGQTSPVVNRFSLSIGIVQPDQSFRSMHGSDRLWQKFSRKACVIFKIRVPASQFRLLEGALKGVLSVVEKVTILLESSLEAINN